MSSPWWCKGAAAALAVLIVGGVGSAAYVRHLQNQARDADRRAALADTARQQAADQADSAGKILKALQVKYAVDSVRIRATRDSLIRVREREATLASRAHRAAALASASTDSALDILASVVPPDYVPLVNRVRDRVREERGQAETAYVALKNQLQAQERLTALADTRADRYRGLYLAANRAFESERLARLATEHALATMTEARDYWRHAATAGPLPALFAGWSRGLQIVSRVVVGAVATYGAEQIESGSGKWLAVGYFGDFVLSGGR